MVKTLTPGVTKAEGQALLASIREPRDNIDRWLLDSGSSFHMVPKHKVDGFKGRVRPMTEDISIDTVMGTTSLREEVEIPIPNLGIAINAALAETPHGHLIGWNTV